MAFKIIYGPNGTDKTEKCMNMISRCIGAYKHIFYVVPEYLSFSAEKKIANLFGAVSEGKVNVTSFKKLYYETVNITGEKNAEKLTSSGVRILMAYLCLKHKNELSMLGKAAQNTGFADVMAKAVQEFKTYNVSPEDLNKAAEKISDSLNLKLNDISKLYSAYNEFLSKGFSDAQDELGILEKAIRLNPEVYQGSLFVFDGFQTYTPGEFNVISALSKESDLVFAFTADQSEGDIYRTQKKCIRKLRFILSDIEEKNPENAQTGNRFVSFPEGEYIVNNLLYGSNKKFPEKTKNIEIHEFAEQYQETEFVAEKILELVKSGVRYKDITVIARDSERYLPVIASVFKDFEIPVFIDKKLSAANQPAINAVLSALDILNNNFTYESVFSYLKTGFSNLDDFETDLIENYVIATGIRGNSWTKKWKYTPYISKIFDSEEEFIDKINIIREKVVYPLINLKTGLESAKTVRDKCTAIYEFIHEINLYDKITGMIERFKIEEPQTAAYYGRVWNLLLKTMDEMVNILGNETETTDVFINLFVLGISMHEISIVPTSVDVVTVVQPENISENPEKFVFVIGANDGVYPSVMQSEGLLSDRDRGVLDGLGVELAQDTVSRTFEENYITLKVFLSAEKKLFICYPVGDTGGGARFPSVTVKRIKNVFPMLETWSHIVFGGSYSDDKIIKPKSSFWKYAANLRQGELSEKWFMAGEWFKQNPDWQSRHNMLETGMNFSPRSADLNGKILDKLYSKELNLSVSSLEKYARCPFAYYANYTLKLKPREKAEFSSTDSGTLMHEAIEKLSGVIIKNGFSWKSAPRDFLERETVKIIDDILTEIEEKFDYTSVRQLRMIARIKEMLNQSVMYIADHLRAGMFEPLGYEIEFGTGKNYEAVSFEVGGRKIRLRGKVDRADIYYDDKGEKYIRVIDYKSGKKNFDFSSMLYGLQIQLVVYLDRLCEQTGSKPAGLLYFRLFDPAVDAPQEISDEQVALLLEKEHKMSGVILDNENIIKAMDSSCDKESKVIPVKYNADGSLSRNSSVITSVQFKDMQRYINRLVRKTGKDILNGKTDIYPSSYNNQKGCDYCDFKKICFFDEHCGGKYNTLEKIKNEQVLDVLKKVGEEND